MTSTHGTTRRARRGRARLSTAGTVFFLGLLAVLALPGRPPAAEPAGAAQPARSPSTDRGLADPGSLFNEGTLALDRNDLGAAVLYLSAARRIEPRAGDIRANLAAALDAAARARGEEDRAERPGFAIASAQESWWIASILLALGATLGIVSAMRFRATPDRRSKGTRVLSIAAASLLVVGLVSSMFLQIHAWEEAVHPEAVVIAPSLSVERGADEPSRPAVLLSAGERVTLGKTRAGLVEIRIGGNVIGWAARGGLWLVSEAPRYTPGG